MQAVAVAVEFHFGFAAPKGLVNFGKFNAVLLKVGWGFNTQHLRVFWWRLRGNWAEINGPL